MSKQTYRLVPDHLGTYTLEKHVDGTWKWVEDRVQEALMDQYLISLKREIIYIDE